MKTSELTGPGLDWAVAQACGFKTKRGSSGILYAFIEGVPAEFRPSSDWAVGGPIIEQECIELQRLSCSLLWGARKPSMGGLNRTFCCEGPTPLIAAMRCYVASRLGDEVEIPEELT